MNRADKEREQALEMLAELVAFLGADTLADYHERQRKAERFLKRVAPEKLKDAEAAAERHAWGPGGKPR
jgi:hypothetical protein